jgi:hypothetical protein
MAQASPETRPGSEIAGYRDVLARIYTGQVGLSLTPESILALHADLYTYLSGESGQWKQCDNVIRQNRQPGHHSASAERPTQERSGRVTLGTGPVDTTAEDSMCSCKAWSPERKVKL